MSNVLAGIIGGFAIGVTFGFLYGRGLMHTRLRVTRLPDDEVNS